MIKKIYNNFLILFSSAFSGGFKALAVFLVVYLFPDDFVKNFNNFYFISLLIVSVGVIPFTSLMASNHFSFNLFGQLFWLVLLTFIGSIFVFLFNSLVGDFTFLDAFFLFITAFFFGGYEVSRRTLSNGLHLRKIFLSGLVSISLLLGVLILNFEFSSTPLQLLMFISVCFGLPIMTVLFNEKFFGNSLGGSSLQNLIEKFSSACLSNATSSMLSFVIPIAIINLLGSESSPYLGIIFSSASVFILLPRYLSEKDIPALRNSSNPIFIAGRSFKIILFYLSIIAIVALFCFYILQISDLPLYFMLFLSLLISQVTLPYSNVLMVFGAFRLLLNANIVGVVPFLLYLFVFDSSLTGLHKCYVVVVIYILSSVIKFILTKRFCIETCAKLT